MLTRHLYEIIVVAHESGEILGAERAVATSTESAMSKIGGLEKFFKDTDLTSDDVEFVILKLGSLRPVQEVKTTDVKGL